MTAADDFVDALERGEPRDVLARLFHEVLRRDDKASAVSCGEAWLAHAISDPRDDAASDERREEGERDEEVARSALLDALDEAARFGAPADRRRAAFRAAELAADEDLSHALANRARARLLVVTANDDAALKTAMATVGGYEAAKAALEAQLKTEDIKRDAMEIVVHRRALARAAELSDDVDRAFFESLKVLRKQPAEPLFVDEAFRYAMLARRQAELVLIFKELADDVALATAHRATIFNKIAHMLERHLDDARGALTAYLASLALQPSSKGARRHAERLASELDVALDIDAHDDVEGERGLAELTGRAAPPADVFASRDTFRASYARAGSSRADEAPPPEALVDDAQHALVPADRAPRDPEPALTVASRGADARLDVASARGGDPDEFDLDDPLIEATVVSSERFAEFSGLESVSPPATVVEARRAGANIPSLPPPLPFDAGHDLADDDAFHDAMTPILASVPSVAATSASLDAVPSADVFDAPSSGDSPRAARNEMVDVDVTGAPRSVDAHDDDFGVRVPPPLPDDGDDDDDGRMPRVTAAAGAEAAIHDRVHRENVSTSSQAEVTQVGGPPAAMLSTREAQDSLAALARSDARRNLPPEDKPTRVAPSDVVDAHRQRAVPSRVAGIPSLDDGAPAVTDEGAPVFSSSDAPHSGDDVEGAPSRGRARSAKRRRRRKSAEGRASNAGSAARRMDLDDDQSARSSSDSALYDGRAPTRDDARALASPPSISSHLDDGGARDERDDAHHDARLEEENDLSRHGHVGPSDARDDDVFATPLSHAEARSGDDAPDVSAAGRDAHATLVAEPPLPRSALESAARALLDGSSTTMLALVDEPLLDDTMRLRLLVTARVLRAEPDLDGPAVDAKLAALMDESGAAMRALPNVLIDAREALLASSPEPSRALFERAQVLAEIARAHLETEELERVLTPLAVLETGPGPIFTLVDDALARDGLVDRRIALVERAVRQCVDAEARVALLVHEVDVLEANERRARALPVLARLALEDAPHDVALRGRARAAFARTADDEEHVLFLARLADVVRAPEERVAIARTMVSLRRRLSDDVGAEEALRALLAAAPDDTFALDGLLEILARREGSGHVDERIALLERRVAVARQSGDLARARALTDELVVMMDGAGRARDALATSLAALEGGVVDAALIEDVVRRGRALGSEDVVLPALESVGKQTSRESDVRALALYCASRLARDPLRRRARALELVDRALELSPSHVDALLLKTDLAIEVGDAQGALGPLERLAATTDEPATRARLHVRVGRLLEEHLLRLDDALLRYRQAATDDPTLREAWDHLRVLARQRDDRDALVFALEGLIGTASRLDERAALRRELAHVERDERVDLVRAERAFADLLALVPDDGEAVLALLDLVHARVAADVMQETLLRQPTRAFIDALRAPLVPVRAALEGDPRLAVPSAAIRIIAVHAIDDDRPLLARQLLERVLEESPTDRFALERLAALLERASGALDRARRREVLETLLLQHAPHLERERAAACWLDLAELRRAAGEVPLAKKAARQALDLIDDGELAALDSGARETLLALFDDDDEATVRRWLRVLSAHAAAHAGPARAALLVAASERVVAALSDLVVGRRLAAEAADAAPRALEPRHLLLAIDRRRGAIDDVISSLEAVADREDDAARRADLLVELASLLATEKGDHAGALSALARAIGAVPTHALALARAEALFVEEKDARGLVDLLRTRLRAVEPSDAATRVALLERIAQLSRYELRDLPAAIEALEAMTLLDPTQQKPREDCARLYSELGNWRAAAQAWRGVLERDTLSIEAWRGLFSIFVHAEQGDEALAVAQTMLATDVADAELARVVRRLRPPFPRWPRAPENRDLFRLRVAHDLERTAIRALLEPIGRRVHPMFARPLKDFGVRRRDRLAEKHMPPSVLLALRTVTDLLGLDALPDLYAADLSSDAGTPAPPFALLPADEPGLTVSPEVLEGGMTPERAFALGRAAQWLTPHGLVAGVLGPAELKGVLEALVLLFAPQAPLEGERAEIEPLARALEREVFRGVTSKDGDVLKSHLAASARDYAHARDQLHVTDWSTGVGYTGDRIGFLLAGDLAPAVRIIKQAGGRQQAVGARLAIKELVLFSVSAGYLALRRELGLALPADVVRPILDA